MSPIKSGIAAAIVMTGVLISSAASAQVCIIVAAVAVAVTENRELTSKEAMTCGLSHILDSGKSDDAAKKPMGKKRMKMSRAERQKMKSN